MFDAVGLLFLPADEIVLDYQILANEHNKLQGVFICTPKSILNKYLEIIYKANLVPIKITAGILVNLDSFLIGHRKEKGRLCVIDFCKENMIYVTVFQEGQCELLREIPYEDHNEACTEVIQSLRSVYAKSSDKQCGQAYCWGNLDGKEDLIQKLEKDFKVITTPKEKADDREISLRNPDNFFSLNLIHLYTVSLKERRRVLTVMRCLIVAGLICGGYFYLQISKIRQEIKTVASSYNKNDYEYALSLQQQIKQ